jgi:hypothetical protein
MKYIYVPQARAAIMTETTSQQGRIGGVYSNEFSSCVLAIFRNTTKQSLLYFHADLTCVMDQTGSQDLKKLLSEFKGKSEHMTIALYHREGEENTLNQLHNILGELYRKDNTVKNPSRLTIPIDAPPEIGIYADLKSEEALLVIPSHLNYPLEYHPEMKKIKLIRRIEEFVTHRALQDKSPYTAKTICVFDGAGWIHPLPLEYDLAIDRTNQKVNEDMQLLETLQSDKQLSNRKVQTVLKILQRKGAKFADIPRAVELLHPCLVDYFKEEAPATQVQNPVFASVSANVNPGRNPCSMMPAPKQPIIINEEKNALLSKEDITKFFNILGDKVNLEIKTLWNDILLGRTQLPTTDQDFVELRAKLPRKCHRLADQARYNGKTKEPAQEAQNLGIVDNNLNTPSCP